jgi:electron transport complex protein RnfB
MPDAIYEKLREQLDQYSVGFPTTNSGIEFKILKRLFTEAQADMYLQMTMLLETPEAVAARTGREATATACLLEAMAQKGVLFRQRRDDGVKYAAVPFVIGAYEFQLKNLDRELSEMMEAYFNEGFLDFAPEKNIPPLRTIPVQRSITVTHQVAPYTQAREIVQTKKKLALADCICRVQQEQIGKGCGKPREVCLMFGSHADFYVENRMGRYITQEQALAVLDESEKAGLVNQPANMINPGGMCNCCGDCCGVLRALNKLPKPATSVSNDFFARVDSALCTACETCLGRCQMAAITIDDTPAAVVNTDRCIGCGLCVTTCPVEAVTLNLKPEALRSGPPPTGRELLAKTAELRGKTLVPLALSGK